ncbi:hypothetical protein KV557_41075 [Kitasatospora aureofaciens]|uniref:hypothetical protein n=1 Tax=Kitasatospora aureofaciens TaxID=1894 RepID=UPI001C45175A|nr:hypothetical protein [Kitasatospora aureofaciens]MBV6703399.1 hypothetical protein [Kitasatospora aureofaciens]
MTASPRPFSRGWLLASCVPALLVLGMAATVPSTPSGSPHAGMPSMPGMAGMADMAGASQDPSPDPSQEPARGLAAEQGGYRLKIGTTDTPAGRPLSVRFAITGPDGSPVTDFAVHQTRKLHFYAIRTDLTGYQHLHPDMADDGTWTAGLAALTPGTWRLYTDFIPNTGPHKGREFVLSRTVAVPGEAAPVPLPAPADRTTVDGYTVALHAEPMAGAHQLTATVSQDGRPVTDLQPYLDSYAHLSAFHEGDQALAHLHPANAVNGDHGGPTLTFQALLPEPGNWRVFLQFQTAGRVHTAQLTLHID